jgi:hypothetical protein
MLVFTRIMIFIALFALGILMVVYRERIVNTIGKNDIAERYLGMGGTYNMWVIIGIITIIIGTMILLGKCSYMGI